MKRAVRWLALTLVLGSLGFGLYRVYQLERSELSFEGVSRPLTAWQEQPGASRVSARLATVSLAAGEHALFEVCADDPLGPAWQGRLAFAIFKLDPFELALKVPLDAEHLARLERNRSGACLTLGSGPIELAGDYSIDAVWPERPPTAAQMEVAWRARILARRPLTLVDRVAFWLTALGALLVILTLRPGRASMGEAGTVQRHSGTGLTLAQGLLSVAAASAGLALASQLPMWGSTLGMAKGLVLAGIQVVAAVGLSRWLLRDRPRTAEGHPSLLGAQPLRLDGRGLLLALVTAPLLVAQARLALQLVPSTGQAPIETFISWPSGTLAFALLGVVLPVAEELFFRGFVYGVIEPHSRALAFATTVTLFTALHAQQSWGNWGALVSIACTGLLLTALRAVSGSVLACAVAHLLYNLTLSQGAL